MDYDNLRQEFDIYFTNIDKDDLVMPDDPTNLKLMSVNVYNTIVASKDAYSDPIGAIVDELMQNFFDHTLAFRSHLQDQTISESSGPSAKMIFDFTKINSADSRIVIEQEGTTGIKDRNAYVTFSEITKNNLNERGSRGQGWKTTVLPFAIRVDTETQLSDNEDDYFQVYVEIDHNERKVLVSDWVESPKKIFSRTRYSLGTTIHIKGMNTDDLEDLEQRIGLIIVQRWWRVISTCSNYEIVIKHSTEELPEIISLRNLPNLPPMPYDLKAIQHHEHRFISKKRPKEESTLKNIEICFSQKGLPRGIREGIAIICNGHTVEWYKSEFTYGLSGKIYGFVDANFLKKSESSTHQCFKDNALVQNTKKELDNLVSPLIDKIQEQEVGGIEIEPGDNVLSDINEVLGELLGDQSSRGPRKKSIEEQRNGTVKLISFTMDNRQPKSGQRPNFRFKFQHLIDGIKEITINIELRSQKNAEIVGFKKENVVLNQSTGKLDEIKVLMKIPEVSPFYSHPIIATCIITSKITVINSQRNLRFIINPLIKSLSTDSSDYRRGDKVVPSLELYEAREDHEESFLVKFKYLNGRKVVAIESPEPSLIKLEKEAINVTLRRPKVWTIAANAERRTYRLKCEICDKLKGDVIEAKMTDFEVENFILSLSAPKEHSRSDTTPLKASCQITNPLNECFKGKAIFKVEGSIGSCASIRREFTLQPNETWLDDKIELVIGTEQERGIYSLICELFDENGELFDLESTRVKVDQVEEGGFLSDIDYSRILNDKRVAYIGNDGKVRINVSHPLFKRMGSLKKLNRHEFLTNLFVMLYYALADANKIDEDIQWWDFELKAKMAFMEMK